MQCSHNACAAAHPVAAGEGAARRRGPGGADLDAALAARVERAPAGTAPVHHWRRHEGRRRGAIERAARAIALQACRRKLHERRHD